MDNSNPMHVNFTDLDLNQEPESSRQSRAARSMSPINEMDSAHNWIEDGIRQIETDISLHRLRWRESRNNTESTYISTETTNLTTPIERAEVSHNSSMPSLDRTSQISGCKRDSSHLVAKALGIDNEVKTCDDESGSFFDCNICLELARQPVLTCCGHLYCWACFYQVSKVDSSNKECPVCKGQVSDDNVIPIYGNGGNESISETELGLTIPPRPKGKRIESVRQQIVSNGVLEAIGRIRTTLDGTGNETRLQEEGVERDLDEEESTVDHRVRIRQIVRVMSESIASLSSLSSALSNAGRLVEHLETVINDRILRNEMRGLSAHGVNRIPSDGNGLLIQNVDQNPDSSGNMIVGLPIASSADSDIASSSSSSRILGQSLPSRSRYRDSLPREARRRRMN